MKRFSLILALVLAAALPLAGQNNPYDIDDECHRLFSRAEVLLGQQGFKEVNDSLLSRAIICGDTKAQTLYYVNLLKNSTRLGRTEGSCVSDKDVEKAANDLREVADKLGYNQYYFYAYTVHMTYCFNKGQILQSTNIAKTMEEDAIARNDDYGRWMSQRFMVSLYMDLYDYKQAREHALEAIDVFNKTSDPTIKRQSVSRNYFDVSDTYPVNSDSMRLYAQKGAETAKLHLDTLRANYYLAVLAALDRDRTSYRKYRDYCMKDPQIKVIGESVPVTLEAIDDVLRQAPHDTLLEISNRITTFRGMKFIANVTESFGYEHTAFELEKRIVQRMQSKFSDANHLRLVELNANLGNLRLSNDLKETVQKERHVRHIASMLFAGILLVILAFVLYELRSMRKRRAKDEQMIADLKEANEKVRLADEAKTRFVQNMSHEIRTPLNAIVGFSQLLGLPDGSFPEEEKAEFSEHIVNNSHMLTMLLDDILNASAMDSGDYRITYTEGECNHMCQAAISSAEHRLQPGVTMSYHPMFEGPFTFRTDPWRVQQILINLLTNACKHTTEGEIILSCSLTENPGEVTFAVTDNGPGVPEHLAELIFGRFAKLNEFVQGTGLGLSICRDIATRMGGRVFLDTEWTQGGARFVFVLPVTKNQD